MMSLTLGPAVTGATALSDLKQLLATEAGIKMVEDWRMLPVTRIIEAALKEATQARGPRPDLSLHDFACAAGEAAGMQRIAACISNPNLILDCVGLTAQPERPPMPQATYQQPVPPPAAEGTDAAPQTTRGVKRSKA